MSDDVDIVVTLHALATYAESANHWTDDKRMMDAAGVADAIYEAMERIEELEAKLAIALCAGMEKAAVICESKFQSRNTVYEKSRRDAALEIRATIAELKGEQDD